MCDFGVHLWARFGWPGAGARSVLAHCWDTLDCSLGIGVRGRPTGATGGPWDAQTGRSKDAKVRKGTIGRVPCGRGVVRVAGACPSELRVFFGHRRPNAGTDGTTVFLACKVSPF